MLYLEPALFSRSVLPVTSNWHSFKCSHCHGTVAFPLYHEGESVMQLKHPTCPPMHRHGSILLVHLVLTEFKHIIRMRAMMEKAQDCWLELSGGWESEESPREKTVYVTSTGLFRWEFCFPPHPPLSEITDTWFSTEHVSAFGSIYKYGSYWACITCLLSLSLKRLIHSKVSFSGNCFRGKVRPNA